MWKVACMMMFRGINRHPSLFLWVSTKKRLRIECDCVMCVRKREKDKDKEKEKKKERKKERKREREKDGVSRMIFLLYLLSDNAHGVAS